MKKSSVATLVLACAISGMLLLLTKQYCSLFPILGDGCQVHQRLGLTPEATVVHHGEMNTWHERVKEDYEVWQSTIPEDAPVAFEQANECEISKSIAYALGQGGEEEALRRLEVLALHGTCLEARKAAVHSIEGMGSDEARAALIRILWETAGV